MSPPVTQGHGQPSLQAPSSSGLERASESVLRVPAARCQPFRPLGSRAAPVWGSL